MSYYDVANLVTFTKMNIIDEMRCAYRTFWTTNERILQPVPCWAVQGSQLRLMSPTDLCHGFHCSWSLLQTCAEVSAAPKFDYLIGQILGNPECSFITPGACRSSWKCSCRVWEYFAELQEGLGASGSTWKCWWGWPECLRGLLVASGLIYNVQMNWFSIELNGVIMVNWVALSIWINAAAIPHSCHKDVKEIY